MKIAVVGCGFGYSLSCIFGVHGHDVVGIDISPRAFSSPRLDSFMADYVTTNKTLIEKNVRFSTDYSMIADRELIFIFVATPLINKRLSSHQVVSALNSSLEHNEKAHFVLLSTMGIGTVDKLFEKFPALKTKLNYVPPQIRANMFYETFTNPPTAFQMVSDNADYSMILKLYKTILVKDVEFIFKDYRIIERAKLIINAFLTNKIVFANALDDWCKQDGLDATEIMRIVGKDPRISDKYIRPNGAVGGSCLPRDAIELMSASSGSPFCELVETLKNLNDERAKKHPSPLPVRY